MRPAGCGALAPPAPLPAGGAKPGVDDGVPLMAPGATDEFDEGEGDGEVCGPGFPVEVGVGVGGLIV